MRTFVLSLAQRRLDGVNSLVRETRYFDIGANLHRLRGKASLNVRKQVVLDGGGNFNVGEDINVFLAVVAAREKR